MGKLIVSTNKKRTSKYSDGKTIESKMLDYAKNKSVKFSSKENWPFTYHFSKYREGILNWYPFKENCNILELGSGCGAITQMLCSKGKKVTSIELEYNRAIINYERNKNIKNLEIIVGDVNELDIKEKYDYVVLNGVLEYAQYILNNDNSFICLLKKAKSFLKNNGTMLLAIENRLGIKYLSGNKEDHLGTFFSGINGYENSKIKTFSKDELSKLIKDSGCKISKWYYPYPDYKFSYEIFTDKSINKLYPTVPNFPIDFDQIEFFDSDKLYRSFMNNGIMQYFANSFLVEICDAKKENNIDYVKISSNRKDALSITTYVDFTHNTATKCSNYPTGLNHIKNISNNNFNNNLLQTLKYTYSNNYVRCKLLNSNNLLYKIVNNNDEFIPTINKIYKSLCINEPKIKKINKSFKKVFGNVDLNKPLHWISNVNIDLLLGNLYENNGHYIIIDPEWQFNFYIPAEYIIWRILFNLPQNGICDRNMIKKNISLFGIDKNLCDEFLKMELHFVFKYVGYNELPYKKRQRININ